MGYSCGNLRPVKVGELQFEHNRIAVFLNAVNCLIIDKMYIKDNTIVIKLLRILSDHIAMSCAVEEVLMDMAGDTGVIGHRSAHEFIRRQLAKSDLILNRGVGGDVVTWWKFVHKAILMHIMDGHEGLLALAARDSPGSGPTADHFICNQ